MQGLRVALVSDDMRLTSTVGSQLRKLTQSHNLPFDGCRAFLGPDAEGLLVVAASSDSDARKAFRLVQEIHLQQWPVTVVLVTAETAGTHSEVVKLRGRVAAQFHLPDQQSEFQQWLGERIPRVGTFPDVANASLEESIARRLMAWTPSLLPLVERIALASSHEVTVLLTGETGTGKTFLGRLIHDCSPRRENRFMVVPCGALAANLVESELFGHAKGAFTGADRLKVGKFEAAGEGTILLDEIDALGLEQQANLLRVIETGEYEPVGSNETQTSQARIITASNWNLDEAVNEGRFRSDLYYRLNVMSLHLPSLRDRVEDIAPLVRGMAVKFAEKFKKDLFEISQEAMACMEAFPWPGNIRQLENWVQQAVLMSSGHQLLVQHLPQAVRDHGTSMPAQPAKAQTTAVIRPAPDTLMQNRETTEKSVIQRALASNNNSRARAANALGISRVTLYKKMKKYGLMQSPPQVACAI